MNQDAENDAESEQGCTETLEDAKRCHPFIVEGSRRGRGREGLSATWGLLAGADPEWLRKEGREETSEGALTCSLSRL